METHSFLFSLDESLTKSPDLQLVLFFIEGALGFLFAEFVMGSGLGHLSDSGLQLDNDSFFVLELVGLVREFHLHELKFLLVLEFVKKWGIPADHSFIGANTKN